MLTIFNEHTDVSKRKGKYIYSQECHKYTVNKQQSRILGFKRRRAATAAGRSFSQFHQYNRSLFVAKTHTKMSRWGKWKEGCSKRISNPKYFYHPSYHFFKPNPFLVKKQNLIFLGCRWSNWSSGWPAIPHAFPKAEIFTSDGWNGAFVFTVVQNKRQFHILVTRFTGHRFFASLRRDAQMLLTNG